MARPGQPDISEAALLFEPLEAVLFDRAQTGKEPFLPTRQKDRIEFEPLGAVRPASSGRAAWTRGRDSARAVACSGCRVAVPMPGRGTLTMRSKARSSLGCRTRRR